METVVLTQNHDALIEKVKYLKELNKEYIELGHLKIFTTLTSDQEVRYNFLKTEVNYIIISL